VKPLNIIALGLMVVLGILVSVGSYLVLTEDVEPALPISVKWYPLDTETYYGVRADLVCSRKGNRPGIGEKGYKPRVGDVTLIRCVVRRASS
jgi:hypothetical protein